MELTNEGNEYEDDIGSIITDVIAGGSSDSRGRPKLFCQRGACGCGRCGNFTQYNSCITCRPIPKVVGSHKELSTINLGDKFV